MTEPPTGTAQLVWERAEGDLVVFPLASDVTVVGREEGADVRIEAALVSRSHARIERRDARYYLIDLGSTNRTRVNGEVITERELRDGDEVRFARALCRFRGGAAPGDAEGA